MLWLYTKILVVYENCQFPFDRLPIWHWKKKILSWNSQIGNQNTTSLLIVIQNPQKPNYADTNFTQYIYTKWATLSSRKIFRAMHTFFNAIKQNLKSAIWNVLTNNQLKTPSIFGLVSWVYSLLSPLVIRYSLFYIQYSLLFSYPSTHSPITKKGACACMPLRRTTLAPAVTRVQAQVVQNHYVIPAPHRNAGRESN